MGDHRPAVVPAGGGDVEFVSALRAVLGEEPAAAAARLCARTGATRLRDLGVSAAALAACVETAARRAELDATPPRPDRAELRALYEAAR